MNLKQIITKQEMGFTESLSKVFESAGVTGRKEIFLGQLIQIFLGQQMEIFQR